MIDPAPLAFLFAVVFAVNLMPAFGPPTWSIIVLYGLNIDSPLLATILVAASAAALGRYLLARGFRLLGDRVPKTARDNLAAARELFEAKKRNGYIALGLFALSPLPSAQLFEAAGLARVSLAAFTAAFFIGRTVSYTVYALTAEGLKRSSFGTVLMENVSSPVAIAIQLFMLAALYGLTQVNWRKWLPEKSEN